MEEDPGLRKLVDEARARGVVWGIVGGFVLALIILVIGSVTIGEAIEQACGGG